MPTSSSHDQQTQNNIDTASGLEADKKSRRSKQQPSNHQTAAGGEDLKTKTVSLPVGRPYEYLKKSTKLTKYQKKAGRAAAGAAVTTGNGAAETAGMAETSQSRRRPSCSSNEGDEDLPPTAYREPGYDRSHKSAKTRNMSTVSALSFVATIETLRTKSQVAADFSSEFLYELDKVLPEKSHIHASFRASQENLTSISEHQAADEIGSLVESLQPYREDNKRLSESQSQSQIQHNTPKIAPQPMFPEVVAVDPSSPEVSRNQHNSLKQTLSVKSTKSISSIIESGSRPVLASEGRVVNRKSVTRKHSLIDNSGQAQNEDQCQEGSSGMTAQEEEERSRGSGSNHSSHGRSRRRLGAQLSLSLHNSAGNARSFLNLSGRSSAASSKKHTGPDLGSAASHHFEVTYSGYRNFSKTRDNRRNPFPLF